jgi:hypothetical protein
MKQIANENICRDAVGKRIAFPQLAIMKTGVADTYPAKDWVI